VFVDHPARPDHVTSRERLARQHHLALDPATHLENDRPKVAQITIEARQNMSVDGTAGVAILLTIHVKRHPTQPKRPVM
jgi:hypothetical protein